MQDNNNILTIQSALTKIGRKRSAEGKFNITKIAFADDSINYSLINDNLSDDGILLKRSPMFDVWGDSQSVLKNKILVQETAEQFPNDFDFGASFSRVGNKPEVQVQGKGTVKFPVQVTDSGFKTFEYYGTDNVELGEQVDIVLEFAFQQLQGTNGQSRYITISLADTTYFDIALTPENVTKFSRVPNNFDLSDSLLEDPWNRANFDLIRGNNNRRANVDEHLLNRNWTEGFILNKTDREKTPKTINVLTTVDERGNSFFIRYRGNYTYRNPQSGRYETTLSIFDEITGQTEYIKLAIIPELKP